MEKNSGKKFVVEGRIVRTRGRLHYASRPSLEMSFPTLVSTLDVLNRIKDFTKVRTEIVCIIDGTGFSVLATVLLYKSSDVSYS